MSHDMKYEYSPVWVCWCQEKDNMPPLVLQCYKDIMDNCKDYDVILITKYNFHEYVKIPEYIIDKLENGNISNAHFSDILRVTLLKKYGGCWIDATIYVSSPIPEEIFTKPLYSINNSKPTIYKGKYVSKERWSTYFLAGYKGCLLFQWLEEFYFNY